MLLNRRTFLQALGIGAVAVAAPVLIAEPVRRIWQVSRNAPVLSYAQLRAMYASHGDDDMVDALKYALYGQGHTYDSGTAFTLRDPQPVKHTLAGRIDLAATMAREGLLDKDGIARLIEDATPADLRALYEGDAFDMRGVWDVEPIGRAYERALYGERTRGIEVESGTQAAMLHELHVAKHESLKRALERHEIGLRRALQRILSEDT